MVKSGLEARVSVAPERLAIHLLLALLLFTGLIWTGLEAWSGPPRGDPRRDGWRRISLVILVVVFSQCALGALVAGNKAGLVDTDWPLMAGAVFPSDYWRGTLWATLAHGASAVQFNHRLAGYLLLLLCAAAAIAALRSRDSPRMLRTLPLILGGLVFIQVSLGIVTLVSLVPLPLALMHQLSAVLVLGVAVAFTWRTRRV